MSSPVVVDAAQAQAAPPGLQEKLQQARRICVLTGAGMSAESGIATFRDAQSGLWARFDPMQLAREAGFRADPGLVWDWYASRREGVCRAEPNAGHVALARFEARHPQRLAVVTQNVDDLHWRAGQSTVVPLHGSILAELGRQAGAHVVIVNPVASEIDHTAHILLRGTAAHWLPRLLNDV